MTWRTSLFYIRLFAKIKYKQHIYEPGKYLQVYDTSEENPYIVRLNKIIKLPEAYELLPIIEVEWFLKKDELPPTVKKTKVFKHISSAEIFPSGQLQYIYMECVKGEAYVLTDKEYESLGNTSDAIFFSRASYDFDTNQFSPPPAEWPSSCSCKQPVNPDLEYVQCGKCDEWFHLECVPKGKKLDEDADFVCESCAKPQRNKPGKESEKKETVAKDDKATRKIHKVRKEKKGSLEKDGDKEERSRSKSSSKKPSRRNNWFLIFEASPMFYKYQFKPFLSLNQ